MKISQSGINMIRKLEGCELHSYTDVAGVLTIGVGHTGRDVKPNMTITQARADELLRQDLNEFEIVVNESVKVPLNQNQYDSLVSFAFNVGGTAFRTSTLLKKLNAGDYDGASKEFDRWVHAGGQVVRGLQNRRDTEQALFNTPMPTQAVHKPAGPTYYTVVKGDNLTKIAKRYGTTTARIQALSNIKNPNLIYPGQRLRVN